MADVLGVDPLDPAWSDGGPQQDEYHALADALIADLLAERAIARAERDFARADAIRDRLTGLGVELADTQGGTRWSLGREH